MDGYHAKVLKRRALGFLENAKDNFGRGEYDLTLFHVEQFLQLYLKYLLYEKVGAYPKTYSLIYLFKEAMKVFEDDEVREFFDKNLEAINLLEDAYVTSRYLPREYDEKIAEKMLDFAKEALEVLRCLEKRL